MRTALLLMGYLLWRVGSAAALPVEAHPADVAAVVVPDSVAEGERVEVKIFSPGRRTSETRYQVESWYQVESIERTSDSTYTLTTVQRSVKYPSDYKGAIVIRRWARTALPLLPSGRWHVRVKSPRGVFDLPVVVGQASALAQRFSITVLHRDSGRPRRRQPITLNMGMGAQGEALDTRQFHTDRRGRVDVTLPCNESILRYQIRLDAGTVDEDPLMDLGEAVRCGIPERMVIRF